MTGVAGYWIAGSSPAMTKRTTMDDETPQATSRRTLLAGMALLAAAPMLPAGAKAGSDTTRHVVLLGDSIFDNKRYVGDGPDVIDQLKADVPSGWTGSSNAIDGSTTLDIASQLERLPPDVTNLVVSVGGNDALKHKDLLDETASSVAEVLYKLGQIRNEFRTNYRTMLDGVIATKLPAAVCSIYEARYRNPDTHLIAATGLSVFNDIITREAFARGIPLIDLRLIITEDDDYANDVEPSVKGGAKIARAIATFVTSDGVTQKRSVVFAG
jgi:GDSL-like Lipase/Acylhydrolase family